MNTPPAAVDRPPRLIPTKRVWLVVLMSVIGTVFVKQVPLGAIAPQLLDLAVVNIISLILLGIGFGSLLLWFTFVSDYSLLVRLVPPVLLIAGAAVFFALFQIVGVNGSMVPKFVSRGAERADEQLDSVPAVGAEATVNVTQTTEQDFPRFLGPNGNSAVDDLTLDEDWAANPPSAEWKREIGAGWSGFSAVNGFAFTMEQRGENELVTCYRIEDGEPCWSHSVKTRHETVMGYRGPRATPTIADGRVYAMGATGVLRCLNGADGSEIWIRDLFKDYGFTQEQAEGAVAWGRSASALVHDGVVYISVGGVDAGSSVPLLAMDAETGETKWETFGEQASYASPALLSVAGVEQIVMANESNVVGYQLADGTELWSHPWPGKSNMNATVSQPHVYDEDFVLLSKGYGVGAELLELSVNGSEEWTVESVWAGRVLKTKFSNLAIKDGVAYGLDDGILNAVDVETGDKLWKKGRYKYGQILLVGEHLLVISEDGALALVEATGDRYNEIARIQALEGQCWNTICIYGDRVLVRNSEQAACYRVKLKE